MAVSDAEIAMTPEAQELVQELLLVWLEFERRLGHVPILRRIDQCAFSLEDYRSLLCNLRAQVVDGSRWITRAASSFSADYAELRSMVIGHAYDEHRDYEMLERDFVAVGGALEKIRSAERNIGTEALTAYLMHQASQPNPVELLGAMFIIEGLGNRMASHWARSIQDSLGVSAETTTFLSYHGANDEAHLAKLHAIVNSEAVTEVVAPRIVKTAKVVARLYALQLEELNHV